MEINKNRIKKTTDWSIKINDSCNLMFSTKRISDLINNNNSNCYIGYPARWIDFKARVYQVRLRLASATQWLQWLMVAEPDLVALASSAMLIFSMMFISRPELSS